MKYWISHQPDNLSYLHFSSLFLHACLNQNKKISIFKLDLFVFERTIEKYLVYLSVFLFFLLGKKRSLLIHLLSKASLEVFFLLKFSESFCWVWMFGNILVLKQNWKENYFLLPVSRHLLNGKVKEFAFYIFMDLHFCQNSMHSRNYSI